MSKPKILILSFSNLATDPRVSRQLRLLHATHEVTAAGLESPGLAGLEFIRLPSQTKPWPRRALSAARLLLHRFAAYYESNDTVRAAHQALAGRAFDLILANDADTWPLARVLARASGARLLFDAHEYAPREMEDRLGWRIFHQAYRTELCRENLSHATGVVTVCDGIADEYARVFGIPRPGVVMNTPLASTLEPRPTPPDRVRMVHHGSAARSRHIETMIRLFDFLDGRFTLDLILVPSDPAYFGELRQLARHEPRIRFLDPVPMPEIPTRLNVYDLGLYLLAPNSFNNRHALPNKFFEFVQGRLAIAIGPSPEMARLVRQHGLGLVADDFSPQTLARSLNALTAEQIDAFKAGAHRAAPLLSWDHESKILLGEINRVLTLDQSSPA